MGRGAVISAVIAGALFLGIGSYAGRVLPILAGYKAKVLCSGVFVAHRPPNDVLESDLALDHHAWLSVIPVRVDEARGLVWAGWAGLLERTAEFRGALGCALISSPPHDRPPFVGQGIAPEPRVSARAIPDIVEVSSALTRQLQPLLARAFADEPGEVPQRTRAIVIVHRDQVVAEQYAPGFGPETPLAGWSLAKAALNALIGVLVREGRLSLNEQAPVPEWQARDDDRGRITIEQLLRMSSGLRFSESYSGFLEDVMQMLFVEPDAAAFAASRPLDALPGTRWQYSSGTSNILARIIRSGLPSAEYASFPRRALFEPLGMRGATLEADAAGNFLASSFMYARARDWARLGMLFLHDGVWRGRRLLPEGWVSFSRSATPGSPDGEFGAHLWLRVPGYYRAPGRSVALPPDAFHAIGHEGQFLSVIPSRGLVVVRLGLTRRASAWVHDRFLSEIIAVVDRQP